MSFPLPTRYGRNLTWPLFAYLANRCLVVVEERDKAIPTAIQNATSTDDDARRPVSLSDCVSSCSTASDAVRRMRCRDGDPFVSTCTSLLFGCFDAAIERYDDGRRRQWSDEPSNEYEIEETLMAPPGYASAVKSPKHGRGGSCCDPSYVRVSSKDGKGSGRYEAEAVEVLQKCGYVLLPNLIDETIATAASHALNRSLIDYDGYFRNYYMAEEILDHDGVSPADLEYWHERQVKPMADAEFNDPYHDQILDDDDQEEDEEDVPLLGDMPQECASGSADASYGNDKCTGDGNSNNNTNSTTSKYYWDLTNLRGGRYELVVPPLKEFDELVVALRESPISNILRKTWNGDDVKFLYANAMSQTRSGNAERAGQGRHRDSVTTEDVKVQVSVHHYASEDGGTYFQPGTHHLPDFVEFAQLFEGGVLVDLVQPDVSDDVCIGYAPPRTEPGDVALYYSGTAHGGMPNLTGRRRSFVDVVMHSASNPYFESERDDRPYGTFDDEYLRQICSDESKEKNPRSEWLCGACRNIVRSVQRQREIFHTGRIPPLTPETVHESADDTEEL